MLKNSILKLTKLLQSTVSMKQKVSGKLIIQQLYFIKMNFRFYKDIKILH
ncbi:hypothetical protein LEP1GSC074_0324 [Leptospira noguchii str. Hook]|nr:hypothetical protein LEP1GSC074_0324 [Leptospira noguchii str. Hook]